MDTLTIILLITAGLLIILRIISHFQAKKASVKLLADEFKNHMRKGQLIDVRSKAEYENGHINGARNLSVAMIAREYAKLRKDQPIYLYCASGKRSKRAAVYLKARGFQNLYELKNGLKGWDGQLK